MLTSQLRGEYRNRFQWGLIIAENGQSNSSNRSAHAAIKGYEYQFDRTIIEILAATDNTAVHVEGIEDVDLISADEAHAIQVKYYEGQRYASPKSLRDPIKLMLEHYRTGARWSYVLHVHFGDEGDLPTRFNLEQLKNCLTKRSQKTDEDVEYFTGLEDSDLEDFCERVSIRSGVTFSDQQDSLIGELAQSVGCSKDEVQAIYLAKARDFVRERARSAIAAERVVFKKQFLVSLNLRELLFNRWQLAELGEERYLRVQLAHLRKHDFMNPRRVRAMSVDLSDANFDMVVAIAIDTAHAHLGRLKNAKPWVLILKATPTVLRAFKIELVRNAVDFNDGHESLEFSADAFAKPPVINLRGSTDKLKSSSYVLRVISDANYSAHRDGWPKLARLIVLGERAQWHDEAADNIYVLKDYEPGLLRALIGGMA
jgi:hypothetical protein